MRKYGAFEVEKATYKWHEKQVFDAGAPPDVKVDPANHLATRGLNGSSETVGVEIDGEILAGFPTPSKKLEFYSETMRDWKWPEYAIPTHIESHVSQSKIDREAGEMLLLPNFRLPTVIHTRSANAKWLYEISHSHPAWLHPEDARRLNVATGDLLKIETRIGYFIAKVWVTEGIRPGIVAVSHHMGRWRLGAPADQSGTLGEGFGVLNRIASATVEISRQGDSQYEMKQLEGVRPFESADPDTMRVWWGDAGVNQNLVFPVQPDPISGQHCWHQHVTVTKAGPNDRYGDLYVDTAKSREVYQEWKALTRPAPGPGNLRRPLWMLRPYKPLPEAFRMPEAEPTPAD
jgi:anaerobic selenocysteine-containing dehydrogenase